MSHFNKNGQSFNFPCFANIEFLKGKWLPFYYNCCSIYTKGINYELTSSYLPSCAKKTYLIYDVPSFARDNEITENIPLKRIKVRQYRGFLCDLRDYPSFEVYLAQNVSAKSRNKFRRYKKNLENQCNIRYLTLIGNMEKKVFDNHFNNFNKQLHKRFAAKKIRNNNLDPKEWAFYKEVAYNLILQNKAMLFVVLDGEKPIAYTLLFLANGHVYDSIRSFDIDYASYRLGTVSIMALLNWCFENNIEKLDFSKGYYPYKQQWANLEYDFEYHIIYDPKWLPSRFTARILSWYFWLKQWLRQNNINTYYHKIMYLISK